MIERIKQSWVNDADFQIIISQLQVDSATQALCLE